MPAGQVLTSQIHKKKHPFFILTGKLTIASEDGVIDIEAPYHGITYPGTKRVIYTHEDTVFITVHATNKTTVEEVTKEVIAEDFNDPAVAFNIINNKKNEYIFNITSLTRYMCKLILWC